MGWTVLGGIPYGTAGTKAMNGVTVGGPGLVAVGNDGFDAAVWISSDGVT